VSDTPLRRLARTTAGYSLSTLAGPLFTLLLTPVYTRVLAVADYGAVDTLTMLGTALFLISTLGIAPALTALYYDPQRVGEQPRLVASALWAAALWATALGAIVVLAAEPLSRLALARSDLAGLTRLVGFGLPFAAISAVQATVLRLRFAVGRSNALALGTILASAAANVLFVLVLRWGAAGVITAMMATNIAGGVAALLLAPASLRARPRPDLMAAVVRGGLPLLPAGIASWALLYADRLFLVRAVSLEEIGVYAIGVKLAAILGVLIEPFKSAWGPLSLSIQQQPDAPATYARVLTYYCAAAFGLALGLSLFAHEVLLVFTTPAYAGAADYVWLLVLGPVASGALTTVSVGLFLAKRLGRIAWSAGAAALANTLLNLLLIPPLGALGAAIATALGYAASPLLAAALAQRAHPLPFRWSRVALVAAVYLALVGCGGLVGSRLEPLSLALRAALLLAYLPLLLLLGVLDVAALRAAWVWARQQLPARLRAQRRAGGEGGAP
jgi:O-antigen/teichoic acid export membrane protein